MRCDAQESGQYLDVSGFFTRDYHGEGSMESLGVIMGGHVKAPSHHYTQNNSNKTSPSR